MRDILDKLIGRVTIETIILKYSYAIICFTIYKYYITIVSCSSAFIFFPYRLVRRLMVVYYLEPWHRNDINVSNFSSRSLETNDCESFSIMRISPESCEKLFNIWLGKKGRFLSRNSILPTMQKMIYYKSAEGEDLSKVAIEGPIYPF